MEASRVLEGDRLVAELVLKIQEWGGSTVGDSQNTVWRSPYRKRSLGSTSFPFRGAAVQVEHFSALRNVFVPVNVRFHFVKRRYLLAAAVAVGAASR